MRLVDANVLPYASDEDAEHHAAAKQWLNAALSASEAVLMPWVSLLAFVRVATHPSIYDKPLRASQATDAVDAWLAQPTVNILEPDGSHRSGCASC